MNKGINKLMIAATVLVLIVATVAGYFMLATNKANTALNEVRNNLKSTLSELYVVEDQLFSTQENLKKEVNKSSSLEASLNNANEELEKANSELDIANMTIADLKSKEYELVYMGDFKYTYYCDERYEHICGYGKGLTASGKPTEVGWTVAADTSVLPMGTIIYIEGIGFREVMDRGGGVNGKHIDILMTTHNECFKQTVVNGGVWVLVKNAS